ncbi:(3S)-malyl-CoA thioesterase [Krasilnikovia cinnamomea]|uniref:(3S)-malyl-CoA thioesterase n=1 Tax=Krasilnikovia cinnamomea TaxID=349313 RepID=A0A4Q7ZSB3_9ACTN|nr:thioesterase family protein [Krasilnikovia cinnamomea]RZU54060.1 (3S)-malyl-CoA thioesterase [Krasilnikovia cinnamomea]
MDQSAPTPTTPVIYDGTIDVRFSDLDAYGHVNAKNYVDYVATTRLRFLDERMPVSSAEIIRRGYAFYLRKSEITYRRPITGLATLHISSFSERLDGAQLAVRFDIRSADRSVLHSDGTLTYTIVALSTGKPVDEVPQWLAELFLQPEPVGC